MSGRTSYQAGLCAEEIVARNYAAMGFTEAKRRWRGPGGEIDLIFTQGDDVVFVEVKKSRDFETAAARVSTLQLQRIENSAACYLSECPSGALSNARIDVALVDAIGDVEILENVTMH